DRTGGSIADSIERYSSYLLNLIDSIIVNEEANVVNPTFLSTATFNTFKNLRSQERNMLVRRGLNLNSLFNTAKSIVESAYGNGILNLSSFSGGHDSIAIRTGNVDKIEPISRYTEVETARSRVAQQIQSKNYPQEIEKALVEYASHFVIPNIIFNPDLANEEIEQAQKNVSKYSGIVNENERIIAKHDRVTKEVKLKIDSFKAAKAERIGEEGFLLQLIGKFFHIA